MKVATNMHEIRAKCVLLVFLWILKCSSSQRQEMASANQDLRNLLAVMGQSNSLDSDDHPFHSLTPSTPSPENINCYVEIPSVRVGGVCRRMSRPRRRGGSARRYRYMPTWGCQAGVHLDIGSPDCGVFSRRFRHFGGG